jgi:hypothetical protein
LAWVLVFAAMIVGAAEPDAPGNGSLTSSDLRAKIAMLEEQLARQQQDYEVLLRGACPAPTPAPTAAVLGGAAAQQFDARLLADNQRFAEEQQRRLEDASWYVKDVTFGVTEQNRVFERFGWKLTVKNGTPRPQVYDVEVQFLDSRGLVVYTDRAYRQKIAAQDERTVYGEALIPVPSALNVVKVHATAERRPEGR